MCLVLVSEDERLLCSGGSTDVSFAGARCCLRSSDVRQLACGVMAAVRAVPTELLLAASASRDMRICVEGMKGRLMRAGRCTV